jgi:hypothetical protein
VSVPHLLADLSHEGEPKPFGDGIFLKVQFWAFEPKGDPAPHATDERKYAALVARRVDSDNGCIVGEHFLAF